MNFVLAFDSRSSAEAAEDDVPASEEQLVVHVAGSDDLIFCFVSVCSRQLPSCLVSSMRAMEQESKSQTIRLY